MWIKDALLPEAQRGLIHKFLMEPGWAVGWKTNIKTDKVGVLHKHFGGQRDSRAEPYDCTDEIKLCTNGVGLIAPIFSLWQHVKETLLPQHRLVRCYANGSTYGMDGHWHTDTEKPHSFTTIYYPHPEWFPDWAGETVFFNPEKTDIIRSVYPRPNRLLTFSGKIPHAARGVSRSCPVMRITLMFKTDTKP
jgi:SM-20-related protein